jgi:metallo-beta-lactamase class B
VLAGATTASIRSTAIQFTVATLGILSSAASIAAAVAADPPIACTSCAAWNMPREPFRVYGNTYYVGVAGLSAILLASNKGLILLDGALPQSVPIIAADIEKLGFHVKDIKLIVNTHAHFDHAGGIAALQRASGASVAASPAGARALMAGGPTDDDPQFGFRNNGFPPVHDVRSVSDNETLRVGELAITAHLTPGHTPGSTTWTWRSCEADRCLNIVYADSLSAVAAPGFRFTGDESRPGRVDGFLHSIATIESLPCDVLLSPHPELFDMDAKLQRWREQPNTNPFIQSESCRHYAAEARRNLQHRVDEERAAARKGQGQYYGPRILLQQQPAPSGAGITQQMRETQAAPGFFRS